MDAGATKIEVSLVQDGLESIKVNKCQSKQMCQMRRGIKIDFSSCLFSSETTGER